MPLTEKGEKILHNMEETYGSEKKAKSVLYASKNAGKIKGIDQGVFTRGELEQREGIMGITPHQDQGPLPSNLPTSAIPSNAGTTTMPSATPPPTPASPVTGDISYPPDGPKGVLKPVGEIPEEKPITMTSAGRPSGVPDAFPIRTGSTPRPSPNEAAWAKAGAEIKEKPKPPKDMVGGRQFAAGRPADKVIGTVRDYAAAAGAKR